MTHHLAHLGIKGTEDWYFGTIKREHANEILLKGTVGMYLIRDSDSEPGSLALSVRDKLKAGHYKIMARRRQTQEGYKFKIGQMEFQSIQYIIDYYKKNKLGDSSLTVPAPRLVYRANFDYKPNTEDDNASNEISKKICLRRNERVLFLDVMTDQNGQQIPGWWRVLNPNTGEVGYVPSIYLRESSPDGSDCKFGILRQQNVPFDVEVVRPRNPNIFDATLLRMEVNDTIRVKQVSQDQPEIWLGVNQRTKQEGFFPFNYVRPVEAIGAENSRLSGVSSASIGSSRGGGCGGGNRASQMSGGTLDEHLEDTIAD